MDQKRVQLPLTKSFEDASTQIREGVFTCEHCLATFSTGTDLLDHKYEDCHIVGDNKEEDEFPFKIFEVPPGQSSKKPKTSLTRTPNQTPPIAACSDASANQVTAAATSISPTPALANRQELGSHLPRKSEFVHVPSATPEKSYSCEVCHQACKSQFGLNAHRYYKHYYTRTLSNKSSSNDNIYANNIVKRELRSNDYSKMQSKISETPEVKSHEAKVTYTKTEVDEAQVKAVPEKASTFQISSTPTETQTVLDPNSELKPLFACKICQKLFTTYMSRYSNERSVHRGNNIKKCLQCSVSFTPVPFRKHKNGCDLKFNSTSTPQLNTSLVISGSDSKTDFNVEFKIDDTSQNQNVDTGKLGDNFETGVKKSSIIQKDANDTN